jgi:hypothetical protein
VLYFQEIAALKNKIHEMKAHHDDELKRLLQTHQEEQAALKHEIKGLHKVTHATYDCCNILMYMAIAYNNSQTAD